MKRKFTQSYKLGISAGILSGTVLGIVDFIVALAIGESLIPWASVLSAPTIFISAIFQNIFWLALLGAIFVALINVLPSNNIGIKFFVMNLIVTVLLAPFILLNRELLVVNLISAIVSLFLYPIVFALFYVLIAKKMSWVFKIDKAVFIVVVALIIVFLFSNLIILLVTDTLSAGPEINEQALEAAVFNKINEERVKVGNEPLSWNSQVYSIAKSYSNSLTDNGTFSHISDDGKTVIDRFKSQGLFFFVAGENLFRVPASDKDIASTVVEGWMNSPAHRSTIVDRDGFFSDGAVGVSCDKIYCYVALNVGDFTAADSARLGSYEYYYLNLNDASMDLSGSYPANIIVKANNDVDIYLFDGFENVARYLDGGKGTPVYSELNVKDFSGSLTISQDLYLVIVNDGLGSVDIGYLVRYNYSK